MRRDGLPVDGAAGPGPASEAARGLRVVFDLLLQDMALEPVDPAALPWNEPILVLRSAAMPRLRAFFDQVVRHCRTPTLHVMSHAGDEEAIRQIAPCPFTFHAYPTPGRYRLDGVPASMLDRLRAEAFGTLFFIDPGTSADLFGDVESLFVAIRDRGMVSVREDGTFARSADSPLRRHAESAFLRLIAWYRFKLDSRLPSAPESFLPGNVRGDIVGPDSNVEWT